jgi:hypothetical protein
MNPASNVPTHIPHPEHVAASHKSISIDLNPEIEICWLFDWSVSQGDHPVLKYNACLENQEV